MHPLRCIDSKFSGLSTIARHQLSAIVVLSPFRCKVYLSGQAVGAREHTRFTHLRGLHLS